MSPQGTGKAEAPRFSSAAVAVLGAIASSVGVIGFVIFVGGAVQLARDRGVGLSAPFAVPLMPRTQLLTSGADQLFAPLVYTLAIVGIATIYLANRHHLKTVDLPGRLVVLVGGALAAIQIFRSQTGDPAPAPFARGDAQTAFLAVICVLAAGVFVVNRLIKSATTDGDKTKLLKPRILGALAAIAVTVICYSALLVFAHNEWEPQVHPIALVGAQYPQGLTGVYVGENENEVYVGIIDSPLSNVTSKRLKTRVIEVKRSAISALSIGALFPLANFVPAKASRQSGWAPTLSRAEQCLRKELVDGQPLTSPETCAQ